jgi:hypothetical protein
MWLCLQSAQTHNQGLQLVAPMSNVFVDGQPSSLSTFGFIFCTEAQDHSLAAGAQEEQLMMTLLREGWAGSEVATMLRSV